ncbi:MAG TPA: peptide chain release factor 2 [Candidatus Omnitrophota bacterium]|nr:peptide chain release factor 2 [Candidatus Omnitrophota bacterium]
MNEEVFALKATLQDLKDKLQEIRRYLDLASQEQEVEAINRKMAAADFWDCQSEAQTTVERLKILKKVVEPWHHADRACADLVEFLDMVDENQIESLKDLAVDVQKVRQEVENLEFQRLFTDPFDPNNAIISINAGAGGTEACDWAQMLFRMYTRYCEQHDQKIQMIDLMEGEGAGIKSATFIAQGPYAYGYLKAESGVHRLVRISPFDANKRRHTSFASVDVIAEVEDTPEVEIKEADLRIDAYRAGGAGGQHVNKTSSAIRITHIPTGIVVQCQNERSQGQNKAVAMNVLRARLYERYRQEQESELARKYGPKKKIEWGSQIRSYVFHPYSMVKDHRTDVETSNVQAVMDGDLDEFIHVYLKQHVSKI